MTKTNPTMIQIVETPIEPGALIAEVTSERAGAVVLFLGTTRAITGSRHTESLEYECYPDMARRKMQQLVDEARSRWPIEACRLVHRIGLLQPGQASVAVAVSTPHRQDAFLAGQWLIDSLKKQVPIWKKENWADGSSQWVHPLVAVDGEPPDSSASNGTEGA